MSAAIERRGRTLILRQDPVARVVGLSLVVVGSIPLAVLLAYGVTDVIALVCCLGILALCVVGGVRNYRGCVILSDDGIRIRGQVWNRELPRSRVIDVTEFGWLRWRGLSGRTRWSPLVLFWDPGPLYPRFRAHGMRCRAIIDDWARGVPLDDLDAGS